MLSENTNPDEQFVARLEGDLSRQLRFAANRAMATPPRRAPSPSLVERLRGLLHSAWGWTLPAAAVILLIVVISMLVQMRPRLGSPAAGITATEEPPAKLLSTPLTGVGLPGYLVHTVQEGETLEGIASYYGMPLEKILDANGLGIESLLVPGMKLTIPSSSIYPAPGVHLYLVRESDTFFGIAYKFGVTVEALLEANHLLSRGLPYVGMTLTIPPSPQYPSPRDSTYVIQEGDTLPQIAKRYNITLEALLEANHLFSDIVLHVGQTLLIPDMGQTPPAPGRTYLVQEGDTVNSIALQFGLSVDGLRFANDMDVNDPIRVGQTLIIPAGWMLNPDRKAILAELQRLVEKHRLALLTGQGWIYIHARENDQASCQAAQARGDSIPCEYEVHYWVELNARNELVSGIYRKVDPAGQVIEETVSRDGFFRSLTDGYTSTSTLTSTFDTFEGFVASIALVEGGKLSQRSVSMDGAYQDQFILHLEDGDYLLEAVFDPQTGALLAVSYWIRSGETYTLSLSDQFLAEERIDQLPAEAQALLDRTPAARRQCRYIHTRGASLAG